jgi:hypothetical protein
MLNTKGENNMDLNIHNVIKIETETATVDGVEGKVVRMVVSYRDRETDERILTSRLTFFTDPCEFKDVLIQS